MAKYDELTDEAREVIETARQRFADLFDSDEFGPFLNDFSRMGDDRLATLLDLGIGNLAILLTMTGVTWDVERFPYSRPVFRQAAILALTVEIIRHLVRSYVEIPDTSKVGAPDIQRRDYLSRWQGVLKGYEDQLRQAAKKLDSELYMDDFESGHKMKPLVDYPSMAGWAVSIGGTERPIYGGW